MLGSADKVPSIGACSGDLGRILTIPLNLVVQPGWTRGNVNRNCSPRASWLSSFVLQRTQLTDFNAGGLKFNNCALCVSFYLRDSKRASNSGAFWVCITASFSKRCSHLPSSALSRLQECASRDSSPFSSFWSQFCLSARNLC